MVPFAIRDNHAEWTRYSARILAISGEYNVRKLLSRRLTRLETF